MSIGILGGHSRRIDSFHTSKLYQECLVQVGLLPKGAMDVGGPVIGGSGIEGTVGGG